MFFAVTVWFKECDEEEIQQMLADSEPAKPATQQNCNRMKSYELSYKTVTNQICIMIYFSILLQLYQLIKYNYFAISNLLFVKELFYDL